MIFETNSRLLKTSKDERWREKMMSSVFSGEFATTTNYSINNNNLLRYDHLSR